MLERSLRDALRRLELEGASLLVAVSGGIDSTVLLAGLAGLRRAFQLELFVGHVNHGLRGEESEADQDFVEALARAADLPFLSQRTDPKALREGCSSRLRPTLQEAARQQRYAAFDGMRRRVGATGIATAHTADDQAETVLLRLLRGCGPDALAGIPERSQAEHGCVVRPMLRATRAEIEVWAAARGLTWREDSSNQSDSYARNRLRRRWLPELAAAFNPSLLRTLGNLAETVRRDADWIAELVDAERARCLRPGPEGRLQIVRSGWQQRPEALARRVLYGALCQVGLEREVTNRHVDRVYRFVTGDSGSGAATGKWIELPLGIRLLARERDFELGRFSGAPASVSGGEGGAC